MPRYTAISLLTFTALLTGCALPTRIQPPSTAPALSALAPLPAAATASTAGLSANAKNALDAAARRVDNTRKIVPEWHQADDLLAQAQQAAARGDSVSVLALAQQIQASTEQAVEDHYLALSKRALPELYSYTGLSDAQLQSVRDIELAIAHQQGRYAWQQISALQQQLKNRVTRHRVGRGESLWTIAGREDIYDNHWLWPLIWDANRDTVPNPSRLRAGQTLKIRPNPTISEVVKAVNYAHQHAGSHIHIGEVHEVSQ